jgi:hypothetical protein
MKGQKPSENEMRGSCGEVRKTKVVSSDNFLPRFLLLAKVLILVVSAGFNAAAQTPQVHRSNGSLDLVCNPEVLPPNMTVTISGSGTPGGAGLTITVTPPSGSAAAQISAQADAKGTFSAIFAKTQTLGTYTVHAETRDHHLKADGSFQVGAGASAGARRMGTLSGQLFQVANELVKRMLTLAGQLPLNALPPDGLQPLKDVEDGLSQAEQEWRKSPDSPPNVIQAVQDGIQSDPGDFGSIGPDFSEVDEWNKAGKTMADRIKKSLGDKPDNSGGGFGSSENGVPPPEGEPGCPEEKTEPAGEKTPQSICEDIHEVTEYGETLETIITFFGSAKEIAIDLGSKAIKAGTAALANAQPGEGTESAKIFASSISDQSTTLSKSLGLHEYLEKMEKLEDGLEAQSAGGSTNPFPTHTDLTLKLTSAVASWMNDQFCGSASGPMAATILATATINKRPWWEYRVTVKGTLFMTWKAGNSKIAGDFEGRGDVFKLKEDLISVVYPNSVGLYPGLHHCYATFMDRFVGLGILFPGALSEGACFAINTAWFPSWLVGSPGKISTALTKQFSSWGFDVNGALYPDSFKIPVEGEFDKEGNIVLRIEPAKIDFDPVLVRGYAKYVLFLPGPMPVPQLLETALPYKNAHFILERAVGDQSGEACLRVPFKLTASENGNARIFSGTFTSSHGGPTGEPGMEGHADYKMIVRACSPKCNAD